ncbi:MFS transporter (plasmid) [Curtobacterium sp. MCLR17_007]|uniref:MFS transporter n=1 Tax=Curtobacterium sp. MCLR17_007 TaxID=2175648 RepID=UPI000DA8772B|nr:MFS transporter [Curtobacterium sp. MCLR17_007]WIB62094.1 MFS transporter [Curtobacterium sp. MCLR17_007]
MARTVVEKQLGDITKLQRFALIVLISASSSVIYTPVYLKWTFYQPLLDALHVTNEQLGHLESFYAITATICYLPAGVLANRIRVRTLCALGLIGSAALTFWFATLPSYGSLMVIFLGMGVTTTLIFWGIRFKMVRLVSTTEGYAANIGLSYGMYGAVGLIIGLVNTVIVSSFAENSGLGIQVLLTFLGVLILLIGITAYIAIPKFQSEIGASENAFSLKDVGTSLKNPVIWLCAACMFFVYWVYIGISYTTPYLQNTLGASLAVVSIIGVIRSYGITLISGPIFGVIARKSHSPSKTIAIGAIIGAASLLGFAILPHSAGSVVLAVGLIILLGFIANGVYGIVSSQLSEGRIPLPIFGTATGLLSVVGFLPDTFSPVWFGSLIDAHGDAAYPQIFAILAGSAIVAASFAVILRIYVNRNKQQLDARYDAVMAEAARTPENTTSTTAPVAEPA